MKSVENFAIYLKENTDLLKELIRNYVDNP